MLDVAAILNILVWLVGDVGHSPPGFTNN